VVELVDRTVMTLGEKSLTVPSDDVLAVVVVVVDWAKAVPALRMTPNRAAPIQRVELGSDYLP
jgi:hypothetical protein